MLVRKEWTFITNSESLQKILNMRCSHHTKRAWLKETHADTYLVKLCRRAVQQILEMARWSLVQHVLQQANLTQAWTAEAENSSERDEAILSATPSSERRKLELSIRKLHHNCGHPSIHVLVRMLRWKGAKENVLAAAILLRCSASQTTRCETFVSVSQAQRTLESVGCDVLEWNHPWSETRKSAPVDVR